ncbi:hypothetical protein jhhlp_000685 [Lomentospora prolificans]|uniref:Amino acid permease/ SLC12A domain-containing protein n=1 Tax=Lomentospora prolificans TaxID=41688 RepID=A0A2N3NJ47_9PEZI|nr:hypothetical protein jhhlp_000685 [Lomentospora prolificans]
MTHPRTTGTQDYQMELKEEGMKAQSSIFENGGRESVAPGDVDTLEQLGYQPQLFRNRSMLTLLFQSLAIAAIPFGLGGPLISAIYGGGQLAMFVGWLVVICLGQCVALSISELASRYPTSAGPYYWSFQIASRGKAVLSFITAWTWLTGNWTIALSVNFGFASLIAATITMHRPEWEATSWQLWLIFFAILLITLVVCIFFNRWLPIIDTLCAGWTGITIIIILISLSVEAKAGRHSAAVALGTFDTSFSGWGNFGFLIGLLPSAYVLSAIGMISVMAEECDNPAITVPRAISLAVPCEGIAGLLFLLPICFTIPPLEEIVDAPYGQVMPVIFERVMGTKAGAMGLLSLIIVLTMCCSFSITVAASRTTWAVARDNAIPLSKVWSHVDKKHGVPVYALVLVTVVQALLGFINLGSSSAFTAFVSVGVMGLTVSYLIPITISLFHNRKEVNMAPFTCGPIFGKIVNCITIMWICFQTVLFSMPMTLPTTEVAMNYASAVFVGFAAMSAIWYFAYARKVYKGPPESDGIVR